MVQAVVYRTTIPAMATDAVRVLQWSSLLCTEPQFQQWLLMLFEYYSGPGCYVQNHIPAVATDRRCWSEHGVL
jgi:hypothetical protein